MDEILELNEKTEKAIKYKKYQESINILNKINGKLSVLINQQNQVDSVKNSLVLMIDQNNLKISDLNKFLEFNNHDNDDKKTVDLGEEQKIKKKQSLEFLEMESLINDSNQDVFQVIENLIQSMMTEPSIEINKYQLIKDNKLSREELIVENYRLKEAEKRKSVKLHTLVQLIKINKKSYLNEINNYNLKNKKLTIQLNKLKAKWNDLIESARKRRDMEKNIE